MIRIATAECFTHGLIGVEIHAFSRGYPLKYGLKLNNDEYNLSLVAGIFIPTLFGIRNILNFEPEIPDEVIDDIKVYDQKSDNIMALKMAQAVRELNCCDIGIGTTAGIGRGAVAIAGFGQNRLCMSDVYADLRNSDPQTILKRQDSGVKKGLRMLEKMIKNEMSCDSGEVISF